MWKGMNNNELIRMRPLITSQNMSLRAKFVIVLLVMILFFISLWGGLDTASVTFIQLAINSNLASLEKVSVLKILLAIIDSSHIPFLSGSSDNFNSILGKVEQYLAISGGMLMLQLIVAKISSTIIVKCIPLLLSLWFFMRKNTVLPLRILVISLIITPGLSIYSNGIQLITQAASMNVNTSVNDKLTFIESEIQKEKNKLDQRLRLKENKWNKKEKSKKTKVGKEIAKIEEKIVMTESKLVSKFELGADEIKLFLIKGGDLLRSGLIQESVSSMIKIIFLFGLLPLLFWSAIYRLYNTLHSKLNDQRKSINILTLLLGSYFIISCAKNDPPAQNNITDSVKINHVAPTKLETSFNTTNLKNYTQGIDVSHFNGKIDWSKVKEAGISFGYAKATQGTGFKDPYFHLNWINMGTAKISRGAYHFYDPKADPNTQATLFCEMVGELEESDLVPMLDLEGSNIGGLSVRDYQKNIVLWLETVEKILKKRPIIYTDNPFANEYLNSSEFSKYYLWIAEYETYAPKTPDAWSNSGPLIWQYSSKGKVEGINGVVDRDVMISEIDKIQ